VFTVGEWMEGHLRFYLLREFIILVPVLYFFVAAILADIAEEDIKCGIMDSDGEQEEHNLLRNILRGFMCIHVLFFGKFIFKAIILYQANKKKKKNDDD
jgi:hypothetical protein